MSLFAGVPSRQALPGFLITAPQPVCVPDVIGVLTVWIQNQTKKKKCLCWGTRWTCGYMGAETLRARQKNCEQPSAKMVVPQVARKARYSTMTEQHGIGHKPTTFPTE